MEIRELKAKDIKTLAGILSKMDLQHIEKLRKLAAAPGKQTEAALFEGGFSILKTLTSATEEIWAWLADLAGKSVEEFNEMPVDTPKIVVMQLLHRSNFQDFFDSALQQAKED